VHGIAFVRIVTVAACHLSLQDRVMVRQIEFAPLVQVAIKTDLGRFTGVDDRVMSPARFIVFARRTVAGLAAHVDGMGAFGLQSRVRRGVEPAGDFRVALFTTFRPCKRCSCNLRRGDNNSIGRTGNYDKCRQQACSAREKFKSMHSHPKKNACFKEGSAHGSRTTIQQN
jgi:hypothetical protein